VPAPPAPPVLLAVPNISEGSDPAALDAVGLAYTRAGARLLDVHSDPDHGRSVFTLAAPPGTLADALVAGAREAIARIDLRRHDGIHPHVGAVDVAPVVFLDDDRRGAANAEALVVADRLAGELGVPVFLYGALAGGRTRAELRRGGPLGLADRLAAGELRPDFAPPGRVGLHPTAGATLVAARAPLVAFNLELARDATLADAQRIAAAVREGGPRGLPGVRALGLELAARDRVAQVSCNVEDHRAVPLATLLEAVERDASVTEAELVGLAPRAAFAGWPERVPIRNRATVEDALGS
jgi:glutamate formiminotransferase/glutamate formiminotransferase/formiminotetrahydrofolate cyclodeaminase